MQAISNISPLLKECQGVRILTPNTVLWQEVERLLLPSLEPSSDATDIPETLGKGPGSPQALQHSAWHKVLTGLSSPKSPKQPGSAPSPR